LIEVNTNLPVCKKYYLKACRGYVPVSKQSSLTGTQTEFFVRKFMKAILLNAYGIRIITTAWQSGG
jgi:hypothetical protein